ncbi:hypothetical protein E4U56_005052 [Claviceps arundinis]|uniref:Gastric mucin-like protein n=1 Tax=Claviceps arundinis TaxID=1623583 RepID=A0A9P7SKV7_9HYPO|nr:hypothetical protein E4U56_005052 [Claviceps arundinis]
MNKSSLIGSIVAFEGEPDLVSTQLRLLPTSSQLLILPSVEFYVEPGDSDQCFCARGFVRQIHDALTARNDVARAFLDGSTTDDKRLVFLNGSTPGARMLCVKKIMKYITNDDRVEAETIFEDIVKDGVSGLDDSLFDMSLASHNLDYSYTVNDGFNAEEDPVTKAMREADSLDRQTANLQPCNGRVLNPTTRPRSSSLPLYGFVDGFADSTPFYVFGVQPNDEESPAESVVKRVSAPPTVKPTRLGSSITKSTQNTRGIPKLASSSCTSPSMYSPSCIGETYHQGGSTDPADAVPGSPVSEASSLQSSDPIVFGEASVLDVRQSSGFGSIARANSLGRIYPTSARYRDHIQSWLDDPDTPISSQQPESATFLLSDDRIQKPGRASIVDRPRTIIVRSGLSSVQIHPVPISKRRRQEKNSIDNAKPKYIDRGTDSRQSAVQDSSYRPVLPPVEDLVISIIRQDSSDALFDSAVSAFKYHRYPPLYHSPTASDADVNHGLSPGTPTHPSPESEYGLQVHLKELDVSPSADEYDPFAYVQPSWQIQKPSDLDSTVPTVRLPTPAQIASPTEGDMKIHEFHVASGQSALSVQNSLRSILRDHFPPDTEGYRQFQTSLLPEFDELWEPLLSKRSSHRGDKNGVQILALGSQNGVNKDYSQAIINKLEKIGGKNCEIVKTGRVNFRYLLANAMQAFTSQRLTNQTDNPFTNSYLLATLMVPQLETFLTLHTEVRHLLLIYPPDHLATVLALQKLIGIDAMKVAQIVNSTSKQDSPFTHFSRASASNNTQSEMKAPQPIFSSRKTSSDVSISKANYLLTSTASETDIATFVSTVWNIETGESELASLNIAIAEAERKGTLSLKNDHMTKSRKTLQGSPLWAPCSGGFAACAANSYESSSSALPLRANSIDKVMRPSKSTEGSRSQNKLRTKSVSHIDAQSLAGLDHIGDSSDDDDDDDDDDDMYERRLMPLFMQKHHVQRLSSRKALKFLGLS